MGWLDKFIVSERGQWDYPGKPTAVPTPDGRITMEGVPYPVIGFVPGYPPVRMEPGGNYKFPGNMVYEIPIKQSGGENEMPLGLPLRSHNPSSPWAYESPMSGGYILPDINRPELLNTGATEYKIGVDDGVLIPTIVDGNYLSDEDAYTRYMLFGEKFKPMANPAAYSEFYEMVGPFGLMKQQSGGDISVPDLSNRGWLSKYQTGGKLSKDQIGNLNNYLKSLNKPVVIKKEDIPLPIPQVKELDKETIKKFTPRPKLDPAYNLNPSINYLDPDNLRTEIEKLRNNKAIASSSGIYGNTNLPLQFYSGKIDEGKITELKPGYTNYYKLKTEKESDESGFLDNIYDYISSGASLISAWADYETKSLQEAINISSSAADRLAGKYTEEDEENIIPISREKIKLPTTSQEKTQPFKETYKELAEYKDSKGPLVSFVHTFDNDAGGTYKVGPKTKEIYDETGKVRKGANKTLTGQAVAHFLRDSDITENQQFAPSSWKVKSGYEMKNMSDEGKLIGYTKADMEDPERYRLMYRKNDDGSYNIKYKKLKDIDPNSGWGYDLPVSRQHRFSDIDWDKEGESTGYAAKSYYVPLKKDAFQIKSEKGKNATSIVYKDKDAFSRFSGGSVVLIFKDPKTNKELAVDVAGSVNTLKNTGKEIAKQYNIPEEDITIVYHDMGSYSAKPKAKDGVLDYDQWYEYNTYNRGYSGAPLVISIPGYEENANGQKTEPSQKKYGGWLDTYQTGGQLDKYQAGSQVYPFISIPFISQLPVLSQIVDFFSSEEEEKKEEPVKPLLNEFDVDAFKKGVSHTESLNGKLMINPYSSATGLYGQLFNEIKDLPELKGISREQFAKDTELQNKVLAKRLSGEIPGIPGIEQGAKDLYTKYSGEIENFPYTATEVGALINFLGRQGTRNYLGLTLRDKKPLAEVLPNLYGPNVKTPNKTPEEYIEKFRSTYEKKHGGWLNKYQSNKDSGQVTPDYTTQPLESPEDYYVRAGYINGEPAPYYPVAMADVSTQPLGEDEIPSLGPGFSPELANSIWKYEGDEALQRYIEDVKSKQATADAMMKVTTGATGAYLAAPLIAAAGPAILSGLSAPLTVGSTTIPYVTAGNALTLAGAHLSSNQLINPESITRESIGRAYSNPTTGNILEATGNAVLTGLGFTGLGLGRAATQGAGQLGRFVRGKRVVDSPFSSYTPALLSSADDVTRLESEIATLRNQELANENITKGLFADYKAGKITAEEYSTNEIFNTQDDLMYKRFDLEKQLRELKVKNDIANAPQQNILQSESQLGKNISDGGRNTKGVFELGDDYVARLSAHGYDDASRLVNYQDKITSPRIAKTLQVKEIDGKVYQVQQRVTGKPLQNLSQEELSNIPKEHIDNFWKDKAELDRLGLSIDLTGGRSNIFYDPKKGFQLIDLGIGPPTRVDDIIITNPVLKTNFNSLSINPQTSSSSNVDDIMSLKAPKGNMYGENQVLVQRARLLNPNIKSKFFKHQQPEIEIMPGKFQKTPKDYGNRITPENYEDFVNRIHGSTDYDLAASTGKQPYNLGIGNYGLPGMVYKDAPLNNLGKDIINAHEKNHGIFAGTMSKEMEEALLKPFGTNKPIPHYAAKHQADEVLARMGQFKNAVGIGDDQIFTLGHLNLVRKNYAERFIDNGITEMLSKIKPGSQAEKEFLINMNKYAFGTIPYAVAGYLGYEGLKGAEESQPGLQKYGGWLSNYK